MKQILLRLKQLYRYNFLTAYFNRLAYSYMKSASKILDIGCGIGELIKLNPKKISGLDINPATVRFCRKLGYAVKQGSALKLPFKTSSFGAVHSSHLIEHLTPKEAYQFLKEAGRVLKPQGRLLISTPIFWPGFYNNLTHVKPYPPQAITRYLVETASDTTLGLMPYRFKVVALHWRYSALIHYCLYAWGIHGFSKTGYLIVLEKIK